MLMTTSKWKKYFKNPSLIYPLATSRGFTRWVPDKIHLKIMFRILIGKHLDLTSPCTFNEKLQWLKLYDRNPFYSNLVDKYLVKKWVASKVGEQYVIPTYAKWDTVDDLDISALPEKFVLKTNHDSGGVIVCRDRRSFDVEKAKKILKKHLETNFFWGGREWPYKNVFPCIFAEKYLPANGLDEVIDYKFMCFNGLVKCIFTCTGRSDNDLRVDFFDPNWNHLPFSRHYPNADTLIPAPYNLDQMRILAETLSRNIPFVRVDFYEIDNKVYFGEMTFYPGSGFEEFNSEVWDYELGEWLVLPEKNNK